MERLHRLVSYLNIYLLMMWLRISDENKTEVRLEPSLPHHCKAYNDYYTQYTYLIIQGIAYNPGSIAYFCGASNFLFGLLS